MRDAVASRIIFGASLLFVVQVYLPPSVHLGISSCEQGEDVPQGLSPTFARSISPSFKTIILITKKSGSLHALILTADSHLKVVVQINNIWLSITPKLAALFFSPTHLATSFSDSVIHVGFKS